MSTLQERINFAFDRLPDEKRNQAKLTFDDPTDEHVIAVLDLIVFDCCRGVETTEIIIH